MAWCKSVMRHAGLALTVLSVLFTILLLLLGQAREPSIGDVLAGPSVGRWDPFDQLKADRNAIRRGFENRAPSLKEIPSATDDVWRRATNKGKLLKCWMKDPTAAGDLGHGKWNECSALKEWGWNEITTTHHGGETKPGMRDIVGPFDPDDWSNENKIVRFEHTGQHPDQEVVGADGRRIRISYPPTNAVYENKIYPSRGVIIAESNWNPRVKIEDEQTSMGRDWDSNTMQQPELFQMSDFWWLMWEKHTTHSQRSNLRAIAKHNIVNAPTQQVIGRALKEQWPDEEHPRLGRAPMWPGKSFTPDMEGFGAILGIDGIWGVPWFLIQHSGEGRLWRLQVKRIVVWTEVVSSGFYQPSAVVEVGSVD